MWLVSACIVIVTRVLLAVIQCSGFYVLYIYFHFSSHLMSRFAKQLWWFYCFNLTCSVLNHIRVALTLVVVEHCASNVKLSLPDI